MTDEVRSSAPTLGDLVHQGHRRITGLVQEVRRDPPTPGVVARLRKDLARELTGAPRCLQEAADHGGAHGLDESLTALIDEGDRLAERCRSDENLHHDALEVDVNDLLAREAEIVRRLTGWAGPDANRLASAYARARDHLLYQL
jgi:hypothetical protein